MRVPCLQDAYPQSLKVSVLLVTHLGIPLHRERQRNWNGWSTIEWVLAHLPEEVSDDPMEGLESCIALAHLLEPDSLCHAVLHEGDAHSIARNRLWRVVPHLIPQHVLPDWVGQPL